MVTSEKNSRMPCSNNNHALDPKSSSSSSFDCSVCLGFAVEPVVTLCGHLYCWPCIYKWLAIDSTCPICKSSISQNQLVPLYGRDSNNDNNHGNGNDNDNDNTGVVTDIPNRPRFMRNCTVGQRHLSSSSMQYSSMNTIAGGVFMSLATAILPLLRRSGREEEDVNFFRTNQVGMIGYYSSRNQRVHEREVKSSLHQIWTFLFLCAFLWWLSF